MKEIGLTIKLRESGNILNGRERFILENGRMISSMAKESINNIYNILNRMIY